MLSTIIYRSHITENVSLGLLHDLALKANKINKSSSVTGILLFNGTHFFQLLEGPEAAVKAVYNRICQDPRHHNLVELLRDYAPARRFGHVGMELFDLRLHDKETGNSCIRSASRHTRRSSRQTRYVPQYHRVWGNPALHS